MVLYKEIEGVLVDEDLKHLDFQCKYTICKGDCCRGESDVGAPVHSTELADWTSHITDELLELLPHDSIENIKRTEGLIRYEGKFYTQVKKGGDCVFLSFKHEFPACAFELLHAKDKRKFKKPVSCELFPLRSYEYNGMPTLEFKFYPECASALATKINIVDFLKGPIIRAFGEPWYNTLKEELFKDDALE